MARPRTGKALPAAERMRRYRARRRAAGLHEARGWTPREATWSDHRVAEARSLAMNVMAAKRIVADARQLARARGVVAGWLARHGESPPAALLEWRDLLQRPRTEIAARATSLTEDGARLRQSSPLATLLPQAVRRRIHDAFRA